jgi:hypothetical protein
MFGYHYLWILIFAVVQNSCAAEKICNGFGEYYCDGRLDPIHLKSHLAASVAVSPNQNLEIHLSEYPMFEEFTMAWGRMTRADYYYNDEFWLERSFDGGASWEGGLSYTRQYTTISLGGSDYYNVDHLATRRKGAIRACSKIGANADTKSTCTPWVRSFPDNFSSHDKAAFALAQFWSVEIGLWQLSAWNWYSANYLIAIMDFAKISGKSDYNYLIEETFEKNKGQFFKIGYLEEILSWGVAWIEAYDFLGDEKYLNAAKEILDEAWTYKNTAACGGGIPTHKELLTSRDSSTNLLFVRLGSALATRTTDGAKYLAMALEVWNWFSSSKLIANSGGYLEIKGILDQNCEVKVGETMHSHQQGLAIGALVELSAASGNLNYLTEARKIADGVLRSGSIWIRNGVLIEYSCEKMTGDECWESIGQGKGVFVRHLGELDRKSSGRPYKNWIASQRSAIDQSNRRNFLHQYGISWNGSFNRADSGKQASVVHVYNAASYP